MVQYGNLYPIKKKLIINTFPINVTTKEIHPIGSLLCPSKLQTFLASSQIKFQGSYMLKIVRKQNIGSASIIYEQPLYHPTTYLCCNHNQIVMGVYTLIVSLLLQVNKSSSQVFVLSPISMVESKLCIAVLIHFCLIIGFFYIVMKTSSTSKQMTFMCPIDALTILTMHVFPLTYYVRFPYCSSISS